MTLQNLAPDKPSKIAGFAVDGSSGEFEVLPMPMFIFLLTPASLIGVACVKQKLGHAEAIHGNKSQGQRERVLSAFRDGNWIVEAETFETAIQGAWLAVPILRLLESACAAPDLRRFTIFATAPGVPDLRGPAASPQSSHAHGPGTARPALATNL
jgi:hypothetical protein